MSLRITVRIDFCRLYIYVDRLHSIRRSTRDLFLNRQHCRNHVVSCNAAHVKLNNTRHIPLTLQSFKVWSAGHNWAGSCLIISCLPLPPSDNLIAVNNNNIIIWCDFDRASSL